MYPPLVAHERAQALCGAKRLLIQADAGGANDYRKWEWKVALQRLADEFDLVITVTHYPPGASKWNPIDHRMFSLISGNWAGEPLVSYEKILKYIRRTRSTTGFHCRAVLDTQEYPTVVEGEAGRQGLDPAQASLGLAGLELLHLAPSSSSRLLK